MSMAHAGSIMSSGVAALALLLGGCTPPGSSDPAAAIDRGWELYRAGEYNQALVCFDSAARYAGPTNALQLAAWYGIASTWNLRRPDNDPARARAGYQRIIAQAPSNEYAAWSQLALARLQHIGHDPGSNGVDAAILRAYQDVRDAFPGHPAADEAFMYQQSCKIASLDTNAVQDAIHAIQCYLQQTPTTALASALYDLQSHGLYLCGDYTRQLAMEIAACQTRELDPANPYVDSSMQYWHIATTAEFLTGDFATARQYYQRFIAAYPNDQRCFGARQALQRMAAVEAGLRRELAATEQPR